MHGRVYRIEDDKEHGKLCVGARVPWLWVCRVFFATH